MQPNFKVERGDGSIIIVKQSEIVQHGFSDIGIVPRTQEQLRQDVDRGNANIEAFLCPEVLTPIEENYVHWHNRLYHLQDVRIRILTCRVCKDEENPEVSRMRIRKGTQATMAS